MTTTPSFNNAEKARVNFMTAAKKGQAKALAKALASDPALAKRVDKNGWTALMFAAERGHAKCVELLLPVSDPLEVNYYSVSALMFAAHKGHTACVELLLPVSDPLAANKRGWSALMLAAHGEHAACVKQLLPVSDPLAVDYYGMSALMFAAEGGHAACLELLLPVSDMSIRNRGGDTALEIAQIVNNTGAILAFDRHQAQLEAAELSKHIGAAMSARNSASIEASRSARL